MNAQTPSASSQDRVFFALNAVVSVGAVVFLGWLLWARTAAPGAGSADLSFVPAMNACFNACSAACLVSGWVAIKRGKRTTHRNFMIAAFAASSLFLISYVAYHAVHGDTKFAGAGAAKAIYLAILASHVLLSMAVVPLALTAVWFAWRREFTRHKKVTRFALPIWLYVSATGVLVYLMLYVWYAPRGS